MDVKNFYKFKECMSNDGVLYSYSGSFSQGLIEEIGIILKSKMTSQDVTPSITQKIFAVFIEQVQNIMTFSSEITEADFNLKEGIVAIGKESQDEMFVISGNIVSANDRIKISELVDKINSMDQDNLKSFYKEQLKKNADMTKRSAGLGLIDMARKSGKQIEYCFRPLTNETTYFIIKVIV